MIGVLVAMALVQIAQVQSGKLARLYVRHSAYCAADIVVENKYVGFSFGDASLGFRLVGRVCLLASLVLTCVRCWPCS